MNKLWSKFKALIIKGKKLYLFLLLIFIIGIIFGSFFITILNDQDKTSVINQTVSFFDQIKNNKVDFFLAFKNSITANLIYIGLIWILGISIIGIPVIIVMIFAKGFMLGFSLASIIAHYKFLGILGSLTYIFPHVIINIMVILALSYYALNISFNIFKAVIKKQTINFNEVINRYSFIMLMSIVFMVFSSLIEAFLSPYIIKFFLLFT